MHVSLRAIQWREHWFALLAFLIIAGDLSAVAWQGWSEHPRVMEAALLFDFVIVIPLLAAFRYRARPRAAALRAIGLAGFSLWALGFVVPVEHRHILASLEWLRPVTIAIAVVFELAVLVAFYKAIFAGKDSVQDIAKKLGEGAALPQWAQRIVELEVRMWRAVGSFLRRLLGR
jgi:hypothetical protein